MLSSMCVWVSECVTGQTYRGLYSFFFSSFFSAPVCLVSSIWLYCSIYYEDIQRYIVCVFVACEFPGRHSEGFMGTENRTLWWGKWEMYSFTLCHVKRGSQLLAILLMYKEWIWEKRGHKETMQPKKLKIITK